MSRQTNGFYRRILPAWRQAFAGDSFNFDYHLMWAIWQQLTDTHLAQVFYEDLGQLKTLGLDGIVSCQSFRAFYPSGLAMATLAEALWNPNQSLGVDPPGPHRGRLRAGCRVRRRLSAENRGVPEHGRSPPPRAAVLGCDRGGAGRVRGLPAGQPDRPGSAAKRRADPVRRLSLALLANHARLLAQIVASHQARLAGNRDAAERALDAAADLLRRTERRFSPYIDTMLALRLSVDAHRENPPRMF